MELARTATTAIVANDREMTMVGFTARAIYGIGESTEVVDDTVKFPCPSPNNTVTVPSVLLETARSK